MYALIEKELKELFSGYVGVASLILLVILTYVFLWVFPRSSYLEYGFADTSNYFRWIAYLLLFVVPLVSVQSMTREYSQGTFELMRTRDISWRKILASKFLALAIFVILIVIITIPNLWLIRFLAYPDVVNDGNQVLASLVTVTALGAIYAAISLSIASLIEQGVLAMLISVVLCFFLHTGISFLSEILLDGAQSYAMDSWSLSWHIDHISRGLLPVWSIIYSISIVLISMCVGALNLERKAL